MAAVTPAVPTIMVCAKLSPGGGATSHSALHVARPAYPPSKNCPALLPVRTTSSPAFHSGESERATTPAKSIPPTMG